MRSELSTESQSVQTSNGLLFVIPLLLLVCLTAVFVWWRHYKTTPAYTLALLVDAAQRKDTEALDGLLDTNRATESFLSEMARSVTKGHAPHLPESLRNAFMHFETGLAESIKPVVREGIRRRINELGEQSADKPFIVKAMGMALKTEILQDGNKAIAIMNIKERRVEIILERTADRPWRVTALKDEEFAARIIAEIAKHLPGKLIPGGLPKALPGTLPLSIPLIPDR